MGSEIFGDDEMVFVAGPDSKKALVLRAADGLELGTREIPQADHVMETLGRKLLTWNHTGGKIVVRLEDPWAKKTLWERAFENGAKANLWKQQSLGVLEPDGAFTLLSLPDGKARVEAKLPPERPLIDMHLMQSEEQYLLITNRPQQRGGNNIAYVNPIPGGVNNPQINGHVFAFDRKTGKQAWSREVLHQALLLDQPGELPVLVFASHIYRRVNNRGQTSYSVLVLDKRTGAEVFKRDEAGAINNFEVAGDPKKGEVQLDLTRELITLKFTDEPEPKKDPRRSKEGFRPARCEEGARPARAKEGMTGKGFSAISRAQI